MAWKNKTIDMTLLACDHVLAMKWNPLISDDKDALLQQGDTHLIIANVCVYQLSTLGLRPGEVGYTLPTAALVKGEEEKELEEDEKVRRAKEAEERDRTKPKKRMLLYHRYTTMTIHLTNDVLMLSIATLLLKSQRKADEDATRAAELATSSNEWQTKLYAAISGAISVGKLVGEDYLVMNAVILAWNIHLHVFTLQHTIESATVNPLSPAVKDAIINYYRSLLSIPSKDISLICRLASTLARSMEFDHQYDQGIEVCQSALPIATLRDKRDLLTIMTRLYKKLNQNPPTHLAADRETRALTLLELLRSSSISTEEKKSLLLQLVKTLADNSANQVNRDIDAKRGGRDRKKGGRASASRERDSSTGSTGDRSTSTTVAATAAAKRKAGAAAGGSSRNKGSKESDATTTGLGLVMASTGVDDDETGLDVRSLMSQRAIDEEIEEKRTSTLDMESELWSQASIEALAIADLPIAVACAYHTLSALPSSSASISGGGEGSSVNDVRPTTTALATRPNTAASVMSLTSNVVLDDIGSGGSSSTWRASSAPASHTSLSLGSPLMMETSMKTVTASRWRWYALASCVYGEATVRLIDHDRHDKSNQDAIRSSAIYHFQRSAQYAKLSISRARYHNLATFDTAPSALIILRAAQHFWNTCIPLTHSALTRRVLRRPLASLISSIDYAVDATPNGNESLEPAFRQNVYMLLLECIKDDEDWNNGFIATTSALKRLPSLLRQSIWEVRVLFMSKLGMNVASGVLKMKDKDASVRAKVWSSLAKSCPSRLDQFNFYQKAINAVDHPIDRVDYLVEYGEWLFVSNFPVTDSEDQLYLAADILHDVEPDTLELEEEARSVMGSTMGSQFGGSMSKRVARAKAKKPKTGSAASVVGSRVGNRSSQSRRQSVDLQSRASFNPKGSTIGGSGGARGSTGIPGGSATATIQIQMPDRLNVKHLCTLVRIYSMLAMMAPTLSRRAELSLVCQHYIVRMWETAIEAANLIIIARAERERILKKDTNTNSDTKTSAGTTSGPPSISLVVPGASSSLGGHGASTSPGSPSGGVGGSFPAGMTRITAPREVHEWITFEPSSQLRDCFRGDRSRSSMTINRHTVHRPDVLVHYLQWLIDTLQHFGYHLQCLPVYSLIELIGNDILTNRALVSLTHLRVARLFDKVLLPSVVFYSSFYLCL
jgi:hypothetical protein